MAGNIAGIRAQAAKVVDTPDMRDQPEDDHDAPILLPGAPVTALGISGLKLWVLDASNQLLAVPTDCRKGDMLVLFGGDHYLIERFPRYSKPSKDDPIPRIVGFDQAEAQTELITACHRRGIFSPQGRVFGRGAHRARDDDEQLVLHMGRRVLIAGEPDKQGKRQDLVEHPAGAIKDCFYPALPALPRPGDEPSTPKEATDLLDLFGTWRWVEPRASALLLLGMTAQMHICGALKWRSHAWLTGPTAAGKSSLQALIRAIHSDWCLHVEDASEAAIRQALGDDTLPVMIDEAEADDNPEKQRAIMNLAKKASSGAKIVRGSVDHKAQEFTAQSCFLFSSVLHSLVKGEERNRMAILDMLEIPAQADYLPPDLVQWKAIGRRMHRRMVMQWPRFATTLSDYKREIAGHGFVGRWQDTFGTLLACADCLLHEGAPSRESEANDEFGREKRYVMDILPMMLRGKSEARTDVDRCIAHLMGRTLPGAHGAPPETVGQWIIRAMTPIVEEEASASGGLNIAARNRLKTYGLRLVTLQVDKKTGEMLPKIYAEPLPNDEAWNTGYLVVAYSSCDPLKELFARSEWATGAWIQSLGKIDGVVKGLKARFSGPNPDNAIAVPLRALRGVE